MRIRKRQRKCAVPLLQGYRQESDDEFLSLSNHKKVCGSQQRFFCHPNRVSSAKIFEKKTFQIIYN